MSTKTNENQNWLQNAVEDWLNILNPKRLTFKKIVFVMKQCLIVISLDDACKYMTQHKLSVTDENIDKFMKIADKYYLMRMEILKELVLDEYNKSK